MPYALMPIAAQHNCPSFTVAISRSRDAGTGKCSSFSGRMPSMGAGTGEPEC